MATHDEILRSLLTERTVDIVTTGRHSGQPRTTEIWTTPLFGRLFICGTPNASKEGVTRQPRDWLANLVAQPILVLRLKRGTSVELSARATPVKDSAERRRILSEPSTEYYRNAVDLDTAVAHSPIVVLEFTGDAAWLNDAVRTAAA